MGAIIKGAILDSSYGVTLTSAKNNGPKDWTAWTPDQINKAYGATVRNAQMYNNMFETYGYGRGSISIPDVLRDKLTAHVQNPYELFRRINGPVEMRLVDSLPGNLYGQTSTGAMTVGGKLYYNWAKASTAWQNGGGELKVNQPTLMKLTDIAFEAGTIDSAGLSYGAGYILDHEYGHVASLNWAIDNGQPMGLVYSNRVGGDAAMDQKYTYYRCSFS